MGGGVRKQTNAHTYTRAHTSTHTRTHTQTHTRTHAHTHAHTHTLTHKYTNTEIQSDKGRERGRNERRGEGDSSISLLYLSLRRRFQQKRQIRRRRALRTACLRVSTLCTTPAMNWRPQELTSATDHNPLTDLSITT